MKSCCPLLLFWIMVIVLSSAIWWARSHTSRVQVLELRWTRFVGIQTCEEAKPGDRFWLGMNTDVSRPCRWLWAGTRMTTGFNSTPEWPNLDDLTEQTRVVFQSEIYEGKLRPLAFPGSKWYTFACFA